MKPALTLAAVALLSLTLSATTAQAKPEPGICYLGLVVEKHQNPLSFDVATYFLAFGMTRRQYVGTTYNLAEKDVNDFAISSARNTCVAHEECDVVRFRIHGALTGYGEESCSGL